MILQELLDASGLGHLSHLTRPEWSVLRGAFGRPRRLSLAFLKQERVKLEMYRYVELRVVGILHRLGVGGLRGPVSCLSGAVHELTGSNELGMVLYTEACITVHWNLLWSSDGQ